MVSRALLISARPVVMQHRSFGLFDKLFSKKQPEIKK
jgi:hypothetical protein